MMQLRPYQSESVEAAFNYFRTSKGVPLIVLPTGTGKSVVLAEFIRRLCTGWANTRALLLTHVAELVEQNADKLRSLWPEADIGIYSAGLSRRELDRRVTFAGIQSIASKIAELGRVDVVLIDEAHMIGTDDASRYVKVIAALREVNPRVAILGLTATPYRLGLGYLTDGGLFTDVCYDASKPAHIAHFIEQGWLAPLVSKRTRFEYDVSEVPLVGGDYAKGKLQSAINREELTARALREVLTAGADRKRWIVFCAGVEHARATNAMLGQLGITSDVIDGGTASKSRADTIERFKRGELRALVNVSCLTTGFDVPEIDLIVMLRPTQSTALWVQMLGRGTRPAPWSGKKDCLALDFAGNTRRLGPYDDPVPPKRKGAPADEVPEPMMVECPKCHTYMHASKRLCPECGEEMPRRPGINAEAADDDILVGRGKGVRIYQVKALECRANKGIPRKRKATITARFFVTGSRAWQFDFVPGSAPCAEFCARMGITSIAYAPTLAERLASAKPPRWIAVRINGGQPPRIENVYHDDVPIQDLRL